MKVCLNMIVKDEARVIQRCLASVRPFIDCWLIVDTGSTDGTQDLIRDYLRDVPGELCERPWRSFGENRSEALALARDRADYTLVIDADEELVAAPGFRLPALEADEYLVPCRFDYSATMWFRITLLKSALPWRYEGVVHEFATCDRERSSANLTALSVLCHTDGARNADPTLKFKRDAELLEQALARDPDNPRNVFYLAQSYRDAGDIERALVAYERRVGLAGWFEEVWYSLFQIAVLKHRRGHDWPSVLAAYLRAYQYNPARAEPLVCLATHYRQKGEWALSELFARTSAGMKKPTEILLVDESTYDWRAKDELAIASYYREKYEESANLTRELLTGAKLPESERARVEKNLEFAAARCSTSAKKSKHAEKRERRKRHKR